MRALAMRLGLIGAIGVGAFVFRDFLPSNAGNLAVGDCFDPPTEGETVEDVPHHPCTEAHRAEVIFVGDFAPATDAFPSDAQFFTFIEDRCLPAFNEYTGLDYATADHLDFNAYTPTQESWGDGQRKVICYAINVDGSAFTTSIRKAR